MRILHAQHVLTPNLYQITRYLDPAGQKAAGSMQNYANPHWEPNTWLLLHALSLFFLAATVFLPPPYNIPKPSTLNPEPSSLNPKLLGSSCQRPCLQRSIAHKNMWVVLKWARFVYILYYGTYYLGNQNDTLILRTTHVQDHLTRGLERGHRCWPWDPVWV